MRITAKGEVPDVMRASLLSEDKKLCLRGILALMTNEEIAAEAGLSPRKVDALIRSAIRDLGVASRTEAALLLAAIEGRFPTLAATIPDRNTFHDVPQAGPGTAGPVPVHSEQISLRLGAISDEAEDKGVKDNCYGAVVRRNEPSDRPEDPKPILSKLRFTASNGSNGLNVPQRILFVLLVSLASSIMLVSLILAVSALDSMR